MRERAGDTVLEIASVGSRMRTRELERERESAIERDGGRVREREIMRAGERVGERGGEREQGRQSGR